MVCAGSVHMGLLVKASSTLHSLLHSDITTAWFYQLRDLLWSCGQKVWHQHPSISIHIYQHPHSLPKIFIDSNEVLVHLTEHVIDGLCLVLDLCVVALFARDLSATAAMLVLHWDMS